jgi:formiminoglutamase
MSDGSSSGGAWSTRLEPARPPDDLPRRPDDPRLGEVIEFWRGDPAALTPGRAVLLGFPQDEGVRRNGGRAGAAEAPREIRKWLYRLTPWDGRGDIDLARRPPLDLGDVRIEGTLEETQQALGEVVAAVLRRGGIPVVLGGGHETAYGHYLGYVAAGRPVGIINLDAHLDVRPGLDGLGHSGSPFRQAREHPAAPLPADRYVCLGAQPQAVARAHWVYVRAGGGVVRWAGDLRGTLVKPFLREVGRLARRGCAVYASLDADVVRAADVPGVSAPNPDGLAGKRVLRCVRAAGASPRVASFDLVEINPRHDRDERSARWAALAVWHFLMGAAGRRG